MSLSAFYQYDAFIDRTENNLHQTISHTQLKVQFFLTKNEILFQSIWDFFHSIDSELFPTK